MWIFSNATYRDLSAQSGEITYKDMRVKQFALANKVKADEARKALEAKGVKFAKGHAHRFRDTFAVELLLAGVPLERVSILLGHTSVKITEKHYAPWGARAARAGRGRCKAQLGARSDCAPRNEGDARGTRKTPCA